MPIDLTRAAVDTEWYTLPNGSHKLKPYERHTENQEKGTQQNPEENQQTTKAISRGKKQKNYKDNEQNGNKHILISSHFRYK